MMNLDTYEIDYLPKTNKSYYKNANRYRENEILNSMKESLDNFLLNLRTKSTSNNISKEELENYYLSKSNIYNTLNVDFISPYENLLKQNDLNKKDNIRRAMSKRANTSNSSKSIFHKINASVINNNPIYNTLNNASNSFCDKNIGEIKHNNSMMFNESTAMNTIKTKLRKQNSVNTNNRSNYSHNNYSVNSNSKSFFQNNKIDFPIKLVNDKNTIKNKKSKNLIKIPRQNKSQSFYNNNKNNNKALYINSLKNIKNILMNIKKENNQNKNEIKNIYKYYSLLSEQIQNKIQMFMQKYSGNASVKQREKEKYNELMEKYRIKEEELEEKNNKIFLLENDLSIKEEKIKQLIDKESEYKQTLSQFKKIMKDVKIALGNYDIMKEKQIELNNILNKTKELNEKNEKMKKDIFLIRTKKISLSKENERNKSLVDLYKSNYDTILKEKEELKKENLKLTNEIRIIKINNDKMNNIKVNNNVKIQKNLRLKEEINNLTKEKKELESKYKNLQKVSEENGRKNKIKSNSSINILRQKKFYNLTKFKNKSFVIFSTSKIREQNNRINKKKKFNKLVIENKMNLTYKRIKINKNKKSNGYDYLKDINELKDKVEEKNKYINILEKENIEAKNSKNSQINKLTKMIKTLEEKNEKLKEEISNSNKDIENNKLKNIIEQMEKDKNKINQTKTIETSQLRIEISKLKMQIFNLNNELEKYKKKESNNDEFNDDENEVHRLYI